MFAYDWLVDEPLQIKIHTPIAPSASISAKGLLVSTHSSLELYLLDPKPGSTHSINVTFSASVLFEVSLNYKGLRVALQDYDLKALNSSDPEFILEKFDLIVARYRTMYLRIIREEFVMLIPLFHESYLKSAHLTVKDGFFQVFGELAHFWLDLEDYGENDLAWKLSKLKTLSFVAFMTQMNILMKLLQ